jgi:thiol:disulfide interchange protein DsbD
MHIRFSLLWLLASFMTGLMALGMPTTGMAADASEQPRVRIELVSEVAGVQPGVPFWVAVRQRIAPGWHTYWKNPGDSGEPMTLDWTLPPGASAGEIAWPPPERLRVGPAMSYGYTDEVLLPVQITPSATLVPGASFHLNVAAAWLVCEKECIPEEATVSRTLPVTAGLPPADSQWAPIIARVRAALPRPILWPVTVTATTDAVNIRVASAGLNPARVTEAWFYPLEWGLIDYAAEQKISVSAERLELRVARGPLPDADRRPVQGVLTITERLDAGPVRHAFTVRAESPAVWQAGGVVSWNALLVALGLALAGGLVLNVMPCVLPILSVKVLTLAGHAGGSRAARIGHGIAYTAGVLVAFGLFAGVLLLLRAGGETAGWGFQLQSPVFVTLLAYLLLVMGLTLSGVVTLGGRLAGVGGGWTWGGGHAESFLTGALAVVVATPCTAPFMATAVGYALIQPAFIALAVFLALGLGFALPYLLLSASPGWADRLPRPGIWMERLKQFLAFPLYASAAWLVWVLSQQVGPAGLAACLAGLVLLAMAAWLYEATRHAAGWWRRLGRPLAVMSAAAALGLAIFTAVPPALTGAHTASDQSWEPYTASRLAELRDRGIPVFMNVTAAWCITCLVNEKVALQSPEVTAGLAQKGVATLKADWTNRDPAIAQLLASFQRSGVPLYVLYPGATASAATSRGPRVLPQVLTASIVLEALEEL